jgi:hypothetical protein
MEEQNPRCWHFVMSSLARSYGVNEVHSHIKYHMFALEWCDDHNYDCSIHLDSLNKVDVYFRHQYESWEI